MSMYFTTEHTAVPNHSQLDSMNSHSLNDNALDQSSVDEEGEHSSFLQKDQGLGNVAIGNLLEDSDDGSVSLFLDSANSSVNMRQNASDDDNNGCVAIEQSQGISQELTSLLYRDISIPHYNIPAPYHWDNPTQPRSRLGSEEDPDDDEEQQASAVPLEQGREETKPFVNSHPSTRNSVSSHARLNPSDRDNRTIRGYVPNRRTRLEPQSLVAAGSPIQFGGSRQGVYDYDGPTTTLEQFHDEPYPLTVKHGRTVASSKKINNNSNSGLEALPDDEYELKPSTPDSKKRLFHEKTWRRIGLVLCIFGLAIVISTGIMILLTMIKTRSHVMVAQSSLTLQPTPAPSGMPTSNAPITPTIPKPTTTLPPSGQSIVTVKVLEDGYVDLGGFVLRNFQVQHTTTLLVQDGFHLSAALSIIEFDTVATVGPLSAIVPWLASATVQLTVATNTTVDAKLDTVRLYANLYPNDLARQPNGDINDYDSGQINFQNGWIPFEIIPNQTEIVEIDVTQFLHRQFSPFRRQANLDDNTNIKVMLAHDNSNGKGNQEGVSLRFWSSESAAPSQRPRLTLVLQAPDFSLSPVPTTSPSISSSPASSSKPSTSPSVSPSNYPSTSIEPSYHPSKSSEPTVFLYPSCSICGGLIFTNPDAAITGVESQETTCGIMQEKALDGYLSPKQCQQLQSQVGETCCRPIDNTAFICDLCGGKLTTNAPGSVVNLDTLVNVPVLGEVHTCRYYQESASAGMISPSLCSTLQPYTDPTCCGILV